VRAHSVHTRARSLIYSSHTHTPPHSHTDPFLAITMQFNQVLQGVDVVIGAGNPSAVGVDMNAAQGTTLEDVTVHAAPDALAGIAGGNGGGGSFKVIDCRRHACMS
jgi:hypothetical protein